MNLRTSLSSKTGAVFIMMLVLAVSFLIRSYHISSESLYGDEPYSIYFAQKTFAELKDVFLHDQNPPMHVALLHFWLNAFGITDVSAKMFSIVCSILAGLVLFLFSKKYLNRETAIITFLLFLFSNSQQFFSTEVRPYALIQLLCISSFYVYFDILNSPKKRSIFLLLFINFLLLFSHYLSVFILVVQFLFVWLYYKQNRKGFVYYFISQILLGLVFIPWIPVILSNMPNEGTFWNHAPNYGEFRWHMNVLVGSELLFYIFNGLMVVSLIIIFLNRYFKLLSPEFNRKYYFIFLTLYVLPIILDFIISQKTPVFLTRYILYTTFGLFLSVGYVYSCINAKTRYRLVFLLPFLLLVLSSFQITQPREDDWKSLVPMVKSKQDKNTIILVCASYKFKDFAFYYDIDAFKDYTRSTELLGKSNVLFLADDERFGWNQYDFSKANKVIYVHSHSQFEDPENKNKDFILGKGFKECNTYKKTNTGYTLFLRDSVSCLPVTIKSEIPGSVCDLFKRYRGINSDGDATDVYKASFEKEADCTIFGLTEEKSAEGRYSLLINKQNEYSPGVMKKIAELDAKKMLSVSAKIFNEKDAKGDLVIAVEKDGQALFRNDFRMDETSARCDKWYEMNVEAFLPDNLPADAELKIYFWNPTAGNMFIDKVEVLIY